MKLKCAVGKQELHLASFIGLCFVYAREQFCLQENLELSSILYSVTQWDCWWIIIYPLTAKVVGAPQMISQPVFSIFLCSPLPTGTWWTPGLSIPWCCFPTSSSVCLFFFPLSLYLGRWFWPDLMKGRYVHTTAVCVSLRWSGGVCVVLSLIHIWRCRRLPQCISRWSPYH